MMSAAMLARALVVASLPLMLTACGVVDSFGPSSCDRNFNEEDGGNPDILYVDGTVDDNGVYKSETAVGELLHFPGGAHYSIEHHLGETPTWTLFYLSFSRYGLEAEGGVYAQAAGNQAVLLSADEIEIRVANDSCSDYYLRVVAGTGSSP